MPMICTGSKPSTLARPTRALDPSECSRKQRYLPLPLAIRSLPEPAVQGQVVVSEGDGPGTLFRLRAARSDALGTKGMRCFKVRSLRSGCREGY